MQETSFTKQETDIAYWRVSMKINNENEIYILYFMFLYKYSTPSGPNTFFCDWLIGKYDPWRICGFCSRVGLAISESHSLILFR